MNLESLARKRDYYEETAPLWVRKIWSRPQSFNHFVKLHRSRLTEEGAVVKIGRDYFVVSEKFPIVATNILGVSNDLNGLTSHESR